MQTITVRELRLETRRILGKRAPTLVTRRGRPVAAVIPLTNDAEVEDFILANSPRIGRLLREAERDFAQGRTVSLEDYLASRRIKS